jgi:signal transduction histidine kinase
MMFRFLRLRLTLLYLFGALLLVAAVGAAVYILLQNRYRSSIDLALEHRAALALHEVGEPLPVVLTHGEQEWYAERGGNPPAAIQTDSEGTGEENGDDGETFAAPTVSAADVWHAGEPEFDAELSPIALTVVRKDGGVDNISGGEKFFYDPAAVEAASRGGIDFRTVIDPSGNRIRVLSLRLSGVPGYSALQVSRSLEDQDRILADLVKGLMEWGVIFAVILAAVSWWLSGRALRSAQDSWDKQQAFVAHAGHELRTPLTMIRAAAEITQRKLPADDPRRGPIAAIISESDRMGRLVSDLLLLSRLDAHALRVELRTVDLTPLVEELAVSFGRVAQERGVTIIAKPPPGKAKADELRLRQVLLILLDNALHHAPDGSRIEIDIAAAGSKILLAVRDHGAGIPPEDLRHVFDRFYRGRGEPAESGSGLGLAIAKELVEAMRGKIRISSQPGHGTTATVELESADSPNREDPAG